MSNKIKQKAQKVKTIYRNYVTIEQGGAKRLNWLTSMEQAIDYIEIYIPIELIK